MKYLFFISLFFLQFISYSQSYNNLRIKKLQCNQKCKIDTLSIVPYSEIIKQGNRTLVSKNSYTIDYANSEISFNDSLLVSDSIKLTYRVFPFLLTQPYYHKDISRILPESYRDTYNKRYEYQVNTSNDNTFGNEINKSGSISRGFTIGNNQDLVVNSNLNLQLSGKLSRDLFIKAAISDDNIPIQPEGTSQQINEFDKVYISVYNSNTQFTAGDLEIKSDIGNFLKFNKKVKGVNFETKLHPFKDDSASLITSVTGSIAKGQYNRLKINAIEGNQGPYKLTGTNNETYIIILSGSEKVYVDGKLLKRGAENDYVINYNTAELSFTANIIITKDKRIIVEFEYSDRNYVRFFLNNSNRITTKNSVFWLNFYSENDNKNQPYDQLLNPEHKQLLSSIGDDISQAYVPSFDTTTFSDDLVLYEIKDSIVGNHLYDSIFVRSINAKAVLYKVSFSFVGKGKGNYIPVNSSANGKVYEWIAPQHNVLQGEYEPVTLLITPKRKQMATIGGKLKLKKDLKADFELALSNNDLNTFSSRQSADNKGYALNFNLDKIFYKTSDSATVINSFCGYQFINQYFNSIEHYRDSEFERDWNINDLQKTNEHIVKAGIEAGFNQESSFKYNFYLYNRQSGFNGIKHNYSVDLMRNGFNFTVKGSLLNTKDSLFKTLFNRHFAEISKSLKKVKFGINEETENNRWELLNFDSLSLNSYKFFQYQVYGATNDTSNTKFKLSYKTRNDYKADNQVFKKYSLAHDVEFISQLNRNSNNILKTVLNYRNISYSDTSIKNNENRFSGRVEHLLRLFKNVVSMSTLLETSSGMESKRQFSYLEVNPGQGVYKWIDYNDNKIKELNEFEIANFSDEACYIRIYTLTDDYIKVFLNQLSEVIVFQANNQWSKGNKFSKFASKLYNQFAYSSQQKSTNNDYLNNFYRTLSANYSDSEIVNTSSSVRNSFSFNRTGKNFGIDYIYQNSKNKTLLTNGFDIRQNSNNSLIFRLSIIEISRKQTKTTEKKTIPIYLTITNNVSIGANLYSSLFFPEKDYKIEMLENTLTFRWQPSINIRTDIFWNYKDKKNLLGAEIGKFQKVGFMINLSVTEKINLQSELNYIKVTYKYPDNEPVAIAMLDGLKPGNNLTWSLGLQKNLTKVLKFELFYSGRKIASGKIIHTGNMQIRACF